jgi:hypothetical protein
MPDRYLARAPSDSATPPNPLISAGLTVAVPVVVVLVGWGLLNTIALDNSTGHAVSYSGVRSAITQVLEKDLAADRLQDLLTDLPDHPLKPVAKPVDESSKQGADAKTGAGAKDAGNGQDDAKAREEAKAREAKAQADAKAKAEEAFTPRCNSGSSSRSMVGRAP